MGQVLLLHMEGTDGDTLNGTFIDSSPIGHTVRSSGEAGLSGAEIDTDQFAVGAASCKMVGSSGDSQTHLRIAAHPSLDFGSERFSIELRYRPAAFNTVSKTLASQWNDNGSGGSWYIYHTLAGSDNKLRFSYSKTGTPFATFDEDWDDFGGSIMTLDTWHKIKVERVGDVLSFYLNDVLQRSTAITGSLFASSSNINIGTYQDGSSDHQTVNGWIDEVIITAGDPDVVVDPIDGSLYCPFVTQGQVRKMITVLSGLDHLEGEEVSVQADGLPLDQTFIVDSGSITLPEKVAVAHVGLPYRGTIKLLKPSEGSQKGTGQMKMRRIYRVGLRIFRSLGFKIGLDEDHLDPVILEEPSLPLVTTDLFKVPNTTWDFQSQLLIIQDLPSPVFLLAIILESEVEEL